MDFGVAATTLVGLVDLADDGLAALLADLAEYFKTAKTPKDKSRSPKG